jgi:hypothetical protein
MKKYLILILLSLSVGIIKAQNKFDKTITVIIKDFSEACGDDPGDAIFCLTDENGGKITERYSCNMTSNVWEVEPQDLITDKWLINPKYKGKKAVLYCMKYPGGSDWIVKKVEFGDIALNATSGEHDVKAEQEAKALKKKLEKENIEKENLAKFNSDNSFPKATTKVSDGRGTINAIVESNYVYKVYNGVKNKDAECSGMAIKNGNQFFAGTGVDYLKIVIDKDNIVKLFATTVQGENVFMKESKLSQKEIKEGIIIGKVIDNKFHRYKKGEFDTKGFPFSGNKTQAVICLHSCNYFR